MFGAIIAGVAALVSGIATGVSNKKNREQAERHHRQEMSLLQEQKAEAEKQAMTARNQAATENASAVAKAKDEWQQKLKENFAKKQNDFKNMKLSKAFDSQSGRGGMGQGILGKNREDKQGISGVNGGIV